MCRTHEAYPVSVSVILPTYNRAGFLARAVQSVLDQDHEGLELIVVDDGSTDDTADVLRPFLPDSRFVLVSQSNKGRSAARNVALERARGKYIAFLDSDDYYLPGKIAAQVAFLEENPQYAMVYTAADCVDDTGAPVYGGRYLARRQGDIYEDVAFFSPLTITLPTVMIHREILDAVGHFDEQMDRFEDTDLWRRVASRYQIGAMQSVTCILTTHAGNTLSMQNPIRLAEAVSHYVAKVRHEDSERSPRFLALGASRLFEYYGRALLSLRGGRRQGITLIAKALRSAPQRAPSILAASAWTLAKSLASPAGAAMNPSGNAS